MCTVTYIPTGEHQYILTHNRDETPARSPKQLSREQIEGQEMIFPREPRAGGTWISASERDLAICILNGAFVNHERKPPYRRSRGLVALDFFSFDSTATFVSDYDFSGIEPFTLLVCHGKKLSELRWDSYQLHLNELPADKPHIWSSAPLYRPETHRKREQWFDTWQILHPQPSMEDILHFHHHAGEGDPQTNVIMKRSEHFRTVSITNVVRDNEKINMHYHDLISDSRSIQDISIRPVTEQLI